MKNSSIPDVSWTSRLIPDTFWSGIGNIINRGAMLLAVLLCARILDKTEFGIVAQIIAFLITTRVFLGVPISLTATRSVSAYKSSNIEKAARIIALTRITTLVFGVTVAAGVYFLAPSISSDLLKSPILVPFLQASVLLVPLGLIYSLQIGEFAGFQAFRLQAIMNLIGGIIVIPLVAGGAYFRGPMGAIVGLNFFYLLPIIGNQILLHRERRAYHFPHISRKIHREWRTLYHLALPALLIGSIISLGTLWGECMITRRFGLDALGDYIAAIQLRNIPMYLGAIVDPVLIPLLIQNMNQNNERLRRVNVVISWAIGTIPATLFLCYPQLLGWIAGPNYATAECRSIVVFVVLASCFQIFRQGIAREVVACNRMWLSTMSAMLWISLFAVSLFWLLDYGPLGLSMALAISYGLNTIIITPIYQKLNLAPKGLFLTKDTFVVWAGLAFCVYIGLSDVGLFARTLTAILVSLTTIVHFMKIGSVSLADVLEKVKQHAKLDFLSSQVYTKHIPKQNNLEG